MNNFLIVSFTLLFLFFDTNISKIVYPKFPQWMYSNDGDLKKAPADVKDKKLIDFGMKLSAIKAKKIGDKEYYQIEMPDKTKYWMASSDLAEKLITITQTDTLFYTQPSTDFVGKYKLQPGDFAYFVKEQDGYINVDFVSYLPRGTDNAPVWIGNAWLKDGYTEDNKTAKEAYLLAVCYNNLYGSKPNKEAAIASLKKALEVNNGEETEITQVIQDQYDQLTAM